MKLRARTIFPVSTRSARFSRAVRMAARKLAPVTASLALSLSAGCAAQKTAQKPAQIAPPPTSAVATTQTTSADVNAQSGPVAVSPNLSVSSEIARACHLTAQHATPEFEFDSTSIGKEDRDLLSELAKCMSDGPLRGKEVALTGRTDPRGESEYNMSLGGSRADSVGRYLHDLGVADARVHATSRGEIDATGTDETTWSHDRRVDIDLAN